MIIKLPGAKANKQTIWLRSSRSAPDKYSVKYIIRTIEHSAVPLVSSEAGSQLPATVMWRLRQPSAEVSAKHLNGSCLLVKISTE